MVETGLRRRGAPGRPAGRRASHPRGTGVPRHDRADDRAAQPRISVRRIEGLSNADRPVLRPQSLRLAEGGRGQLQVDRRGRGREPARAHPRRVDSTRRSDDAADARMRRQRPSLPRSSAARVAVGSRGRRHGRLDRRSVGGGLGTGEAQVGGGRCRPGRRGLGGHRRRRPHPRRHSLRPRHPARQGHEARIDSRHEDERRESNGVARGTASGGPRRLVRHGCGQVADADRRHRQTAQRLLADDRLLGLRAPRRNGDAHPGHADAAEGVDRPARFRRSRPGQPADDGDRGGLGRRRRTAGRGQHGRRHDLGRRPVHDRRESLLLAALGVSVDADHARPR